MAIAGVDALDIAHAGRTIRTRLAPRHPAAVRPPTLRRRALARPPLRARRARTGSTCTGTSPRRRRGRSSCICTPADSSRARRVARAGRVCCSSPHTADAPISANYRLRAAGAFPASQLDVARVIAWVAEHADRLGVDTRQIYGYLGPRGADPSSSPTYRIRPDASSPVMIVHGARDTALAPARARAVAATIRAASSSPVRRRRAARDAARIRPARPAQAITRRPPRSAPPGAHARGPRRSDRRGPLDVGERLT